MMMYDPELPAGFQDADFEVRDLEAAAADHRRLRRQGYCTHQSGQGPRCTDGCGTTFPSVEALWQAEPLPMTCRACSGDVFEGRDWKLHHVDTELDRTCGSVVPR